MAWRNDQVSELETEKIVSLARECLNVPGDFVEMGCYKGDTSLLLAEVLEGADKQLYIYDSFEGLPSGREEDGGASDSGFVAGALSVTKREVKARFLRAGMKVPVIKKAWFNELTEADLPEEISFAFLDGDLYESIRDSLNLICGKMNRAGIIVVHDYNNPVLPGVARAVDEWLKEHPHKTSIYQSMIVLS